MGAAGVEAGLRTLPALRSWGRSRAEEPGTSSNPLPRPGSTAPHEEGRCCRTHHVVQCCRHLPNRCTAAADPKAGASDVTLTSDTTPRRGGIREGAGGRFRSTRPARAADVGLRCARSAARLSAAQVVASNSRWRPAAVRGRPAARTRVGVGAGFGGATGGRLGLHSRDRWGAWGFGGETGGPPRARRIVRSHPSRAYKSQPRSFPRPGAGSAAPLPRPACYFAAARLTAGADRGCLPRRATEKR